MNSSFSGRTLLFGVCYVQLFLFVCIEEIKEFMGCLFKYILSKYCTVLMLYY
jgi:hypothetical protein